MLRTVTSAKRLAAVTVAGGAILLGGLVTAGALPGAEQAAADALDHVGITVPSPNEASNGHTDVRGKSVEHTTDQGAPMITPASTPPDTTSNGQGSEISQTARTTDATGVDKGAQIYGPGKQWPEPRRRGAPEHRRPPIGPEQARRAKRTTVANGPYATDPRGLPRPVTGHLSVKRHP